jgi:hypothetical protein
MVVKNRFWGWFFSAHFLCSGLAYAHPHLRLAYQIQPLLANGALRGFHISWQMDAPNSLQVRENIDLNQNAVLDPDELQAFADSNSMALLITDGNRIVSDDGKLGHQLTEATIALQNSCDVALALVASSIIIGGSLIFKMWKMSRDV